MQLLVKCPTCDAGLPLSAAESPAAIACGRCGSQIELAFSEAVKADSEVDRCPVCRGGEFYLRKDFNPKAGVVVVIVGAIISGAFYWFGMDLVAYGVLACAALVDLIVYQRLGDVTVCYRCHAEFRGTYRRIAAAFDLHTADLLEQEYERKIGRR